MPAYKYTLKNGKTKWYANFYYEDWMGVRQHKCKRGFDTKGAAKEYERMFLDKFSKNPTILFSSLVDNYLEDLSSRLKPTTIKNKQYMIQTKLLPYFGKMRICDIDEDVVRHWQNEMINYRDEKGEPYAETYLHSMNSQLSAALNYATRFYKLQGNPCRIAGTIGESRAEEMNFWTQEQFNRALEFEQKEHYRVAFKTLFYSGMREGEVLALTPEDIPRDTAIIDVNKNYAVVEGKEYFLTPKTKRSIRRVTIPESVHQELLEFIDGMGLNHSERIFYFGKGGLYKEFKRMIKNSGETEIRVHDLRHSHVSMLVKMGFQIEDISRRLGHDSIKTTWDTYSHLYPDSDKVLADKIEVLIKQEESEKDAKSNSLIPDNILVSMVPGSPLSKASQYFLSKASEEGNDHIRKNNKNIFSKYGINIDEEELYGYPISSYLDLIAFGDAIIHIISTFRPDPEMKDFVLAVFSDSISTCEMINGSIEKLDDFIVQSTIPKYSKLCGKNGNF